MNVIYPPAGEAPCSPQRPNAPGGGGQTAGQRETEAPVRCPGQHHRALDSNQDGGTALLQHYTRLSEVEKETALELLSLCSCQRTIKAKFGTLELEEYWQLLTFY